MDSGKSIRNLAVSLHSLLGLKTHLTSNWVKSISDIIKTLPSEKSVDMQPTNSDTDDDDDDGDDDSVTKIKDELTFLSNYINQLNIKRRQILHEFLDLKGNIRVFCRIRPITGGENFGHLRPVVASNSNEVVLRLMDNKTKSYNFDQVFHPGSSQVGNFQIKFLQKLNPSSNQSLMVTMPAFLHMGKPAQEKLSQCLSIQADPKGEIVIGNLVAIEVNDFNQALRLYRLGCRLRTTASTNSNLTSSRSHCMIRVAITCFDAAERRRETNKLWLIDLGGSERVLKTKASGKRLDEGKAINLSLSALGDVISSLQRKRHHIPYRNSKLTQVLKDSLGDDSKTIMLVHVSPKEEDLCETICSLNFATRAKSVHLGNEDTTEAKEKREVAMADLQQKMKHIEDERLLVRSDIDKLKKKLENLTGTNPSSEEQLEAFHASIKEQLTKSRIVDVTVTPLSKVPRFMRPTICSKRKSGTGYQTYEGRDDTVLERRRRPTSQRAESLSFPVKDRSDYNSDRSISRSSCLAELNMKISADNATECSQDASETDFKSNVLREQERAPRSLISQKAGIGHIQKNSSRLVNKINHIKISKVDSWLHLQKSESTPSRCSQRTKRVLAVPIPEKKHKSNVQGKADDKVQGYVYTKQDVVNHDKLNNLATKGAVGKPMSEVVIEKPLKMLRDLFNEDSRSDVTTPLQTTGGETTIQIQHSADGLLTRDSEYDTFSPPDGCSPRLEECEGRKGVSLGGKIQSSDSFLVKNSGCYPSELYTTSVCSKRDFGVSFSMLELESCFQQAPTESNMEDSKTQGFYSFQPLEKETRHGLLQLKSQRALFMNSENRENLAVPFGKPEGKIQNTGICHVVKQKFEILCFSALLGLGLHNLGFDHDFFYGLML